MEYVQLVQLAKSKADEHNIARSLLCAIVETESDWNPWAIRFEPAFERRYIKPENPDYLNTEEVAKAMSFGLLQIMGEVARELNFPGKFLSELCDPFTGLEYGCRHFANKLKFAQGDIRTALLHWNGGSNLDYPNVVMARMGKYV